MDSTGPKSTANFETPLTKREAAPTLSGEALSAYLLALTANATTALTALQVCKQAKLDGHVVNGTTVEHALELLVTTGDLFRHPHAGSRQSYGRESADAWVQLRLRRVLATNPQITLSQLRAVAPKCYADVIDTAIATLLRAGKLFEKPGSKAKAFATTLPSATSILTAAQRKSLEGMLRKLNERRSPPLTLQALLRFLDGDAPAASNPVAPPAPTLALLGELYRLDLPARGGLSSMPIPVTWRRYTQQSSSADRAAFEQLLIDGAAAGRLELIAHEWPATLAAEDLAAAIRQPSGRVLYYWRPLEQP